MSKYAGPTGEQVFALLERERQELIALRASTPADDIVRNAEITAKFGMYGRLWMRCFEAQRKRIEWKNDTKSQ